MRVSLAVRDRQALVSGVAGGLLDPHGARVILGQAPSALAAPIAPAPHTLFGPRGACIVGPNGPLVVCDTGHHRILTWNRRPQSDNAPADLVIGQPDLFSEGRNGHGEVGAATVNVPTGVAAGDGALAVADAWNHRVLLWHHLPTTSNQPADVVLGQADFTSALANRGLPSPRADTLNWCFGVAIHDGRLFVADTGNRRVLAWDRIPTANGTPADLVLGQPDFDLRDENAGGAQDGVGMRWPHAVVVADSRILVADAGNHRIMVWDDLPGRPGTPCRFVLGQRDHARTDANRTGPAPTAATLDQPYGVTLLGDRVIVADTANSRLLGFAPDRLSMDAAAEALAGQSTFDQKGDNGWRPIGRDTLSWPYGVAGSDNTLVIADTGNNRVLLWEAA